MSTYGLRRMGPIWEDDEEEEGASFGGSGLGSGGSWEVMGMGWYS